MYSVRVAFVIKRLAPAPLLSPSVSLSCRNRESENGVADVVERKGRVLLLRPREHLDTFHSTFLRSARLTHARARARLRLSFSSRNRLSCVAARLRASASGQFSAVQQRASEGGGGDRGKVTRLILCAAGGKVSYRDNDRALLARHTPYEDYSVCDASR